MNPQNENRPDKNQQPQEESVQTNPLKGGVDKFGPPEPAKVAFSGEKPLVLDPTLLPFIND